ncbi:MAG: FAD-dependent oxidoreductase [Ignavibacteriaceae bacterium]|nr:FAD-dependent oxidoreductase [Ignavibacteriaceae bacterium]
MKKIERDLGKASNENYDVIIIGGGIYGACLLLTAAQAGKKALLLEKEDFGAATSFNNLRTVHGGLRYLQSLDLKRIFESVAERRWFFRNFPDLVKPLPCLMPLYGNGVYRPSIFRLALILNDLLSSNRNTGVVIEKHLPNGQIINNAKVKQIFPQVDVQNLKGGAVWYDGAMPDSQKVLIEIIKWACELGGKAINYAEVTDLKIKNGLVTGVKAQDKTSEYLYEFSSSKVINSSGPWCRSLAAKFDRDYPELFKDSFAWNVLFNKPALSTHALAVTPKKPGARTYFIHHWKGFLFAGTVHSPWNNNSRKPIPDENAVKNFITELNSSINDLNLSESDVLQIFPGLLPAKEEGSDKIAVREIILDHGTNGGPKGFYSVSGVKYTTARLVAEKTLKKIFGKEIKISSPDGRDTATSRELGIFENHWIPEKPNGWETTLKNIIQNESVVHLDDLLIRRTSLGDNPKLALKYSDKYCNLFNWNEQKTSDEISRLKEFYNSRRITNLDLSN